MSVENIAAVKVGVTHQLMASPHGGTMMAYTWYAAFDLFLVLFSASICIFLAPAAVGSGIPDVKAYLNGIDIPHALSGRTLMAKGAAVIGSVASGLAVGKEGPFVAIGAAIGACLSRAASKVVRAMQDMAVYAVDWEMQDMVTCGAAAGVAAAFRAPVGMYLYPSHICYHAQP